MLVFFKGVVFICHGFAEHTIYYDDFGVMLAKQNLIAFAHDHLGHGLSEGKRATIDSLDEVHIKSFCRTTVIKGA